MYLQRVRRRDTRSAGSKSAGGYCSKKHNRYVTTQQVVVIQGGDSKDHHRVQSSYYVSGSVSLDIQLLRDNSKLGWYLERGMDEVKSFFRIAVQQIMENLNCKARKRTR
eukprot:scaffold1008_cov174-Amphora_coffeaeformis.AAC.1